MAFGPRAALALAQADQADPLAPAPQGPRRTIDASWTKAELLLLVYERRHGQFAGRNSPGDFSWKTWCQYVSIQPQSLFILKSSIRHPLYILPVHPSM